LKPLVSAQTEFIETALNVSLDDVDIFRPITDQEIIHVERTFNTRRDGFNYGVDL